MDQRNAVRDALEGGSVVFGARAATFSPTVVEVYGELGLDFVWLDFEHTGPSPYDSTVLEDLTRAAEVSGTELLVRIPSSRPPLVRKVLDAGVRNLLVPRVDSADEVREVLEASRFVFDGEPGERGMASGRSRTWGSATNYAEREDEAVLVGVMIEKTTAVDQLDAILAVPQLGFVFIGPSDLSVQLGHPDDQSHQSVSERVADIRSTCLSSDVAVGAIAHDPSDAVAAVRDGCRLVRIGGDLESAREMLGERLTAIRKEV